MANFRSYKINRFITGGLSLLFGLALLVVVWMFGNKSGAIIFLGFLLSALIFLLGLFDLLQVNRTLPDEA